MAVIKPTLTLTANANTATTDAGPASIALSLSATPTDGTSTVTDFQTTIYETTTAHVSVYTHTDDQKVWVYISFLICRLGRPNFQRTMSPRIGKMSLCFAPNLITSELGSN